MFRKLRQFLAARQSSYTPEHPLVSHKTNAPPSAPAWVLRLPPTQRPAKGTEWQVRWGLPNELLTNKWTWYWTYGSDQLQRLTTETGPLLVADIEEWWEEQSRLGPTLCAV